MFVYQTSLLETLFKTSPDPSAFLVENVTERVIDKDAGGDEANAVNISAIIAEAEHNKQETKAQVSHR